MYDPTLIARMPFTMDKGLSLPHHSTAAINLGKNDGNSLAAYNDEAWCIDLAITEQDNHTLLHSFQHVTTAIVLATLHEDFDTLREGIAAIYYTKVGHGKVTAQNGRMRPDQLPTLIIQHGNHQSRVPQELNSAGLRDVLNQVMVLAKHSREDNAILAVMPRTTLRRGGVSTSKALGITLDSHRVETD